MGDVTVLETIEKIVIEEESEEITELFSSIEIIEIVEEGPQGIPGPPGLGFPVVEDVTIGVTPPATYVLGNVPIVYSVELYVNGLRQLNSAFSVTGQVVTLPGNLFLTTGDKIEFVYLS